MGMDGASPLFAGACTEPQKELLWQKLQSPEHLWCACGLSTVDQSAPYYRRAGYWNGAVWMPYQWMFFKSALDAGLADFAYRIADTALTPVSYTHLADPLGGRTDKSDLWSGLCCSGCFCHRAALP